MSRKKIPISDLNLQKVGGRIAFLRIKNGLTQAQLSEKTGISRGNVSGLESHKFEPSTKAIIKIVELFGVTADWLLFGDKAKSDKKPLSEILLDRFKDPAMIREMNQDLLTLEKIDFEGFEEIHKIIKMKLETKKPLLEKKKEKRKKTS